MTRVRRRHAGILVESSHVAIRAYIGILAIGFAMEEYTLKTSEQYGWKYSGLYT